MKKNEKKNENKIKTTGGEMSTLIGSRQGLYRPPSSTVATDIQFDPQLFCTTLVSSCSSSNLPVSPLSSVDLRLDDS